MNPNDMVDTRVMGNEQRMHELFRYFREHDPVPYVEHSGYDPFWALTKYEDIKSVGSQNNRFLSAPRTVLAPKAFEQVLIDNFGNRNGLETLIHMDAPKHLKLRRVTRDWFLPRNVAKLESQCKLLAKEYVDKMQDMGGSCDFARDIAINYPVRVILSMLGLPQEDEPLIVKLTQELFGGQDPTQQRGDVNEIGVSVINDLLEYFTAIIEDRKKNPTDDLSTVLANAQIDGEPMDTMDQISYFIIAATAGHDTTSATVAGGMKALIENPHQLRRWSDDPALDMTGAKELMRWVSPVRHMVRTATEDVEIRGKHIKKGENLVLWFPSANRDEEVIANANQLDVGRDPKLHLAFGYGAHMCLGQHLANLEVSCFFRELLPRLGDIELASEPEGIEAIFVGGIKSMPINYQLQ